MLTASSSKVIIVQHSPDCYRPCCRLVLLIRQPPPSLWHKMASSSHLEVPKDGAAFETWADLRRALGNWAIRDKFTFRTPKKTPLAATYCCAEEGCNWKVCAQKGDGGLLVLAIKKSEHNCLGRGVPKKGAAANADWLDDVVVQHLNVTKATKPREIQECLRVRFGEEISYRVAHLCRQRLLDEDIGTHILCVESPFKAQQTSSTTAPSLRSYYLRCL